jgi:predicted permease
VHEWLACIHHRFQRRRLEDASAHGPRAHGLDALGQDLGRAVRGLSRDPALTLTIVLTLGLGIGANAAMFNVVDRLMYRPLAFLRDPASVYRVYWQWQNRGTAASTMSTYYTRYLDLQNDTTSFAALAAFSERDLAIADGDLARERRIGAVSASYFEFFDARPVLGRFFTRDEDVTPRGADVVVLGHAFWQSSFGGRNVIGERLHVGNINAAIIGVAPPGFHGVADTNPPAVFVPITTFADSTGTGDAVTYFSRYQWGWVNVLVRLRPGIAVAEAEADADRAFRRSWQAAAADEPRLPPVDAAAPHVAIASVRPGSGPTPALEARTALWLAAVSLLVLAVAGANVASLLLARALRRRHETALRLALGISRLRLYRQSILEAVILALASAASALLIAEWAGESLRRLLMGAVGDGGTVFLDARTLLVTLVLAVATGVLVGLVPVRISVRGDVAPLLRGGGRGGAAEGTRLRASLLVVQATLSVVLLIGAVLFVRSQWAVQALPLGYDVDRVLLVNRVIRGVSFDSASQRALRDSLLTTAQSLPEVESAAWVSSAPFVSTSSTRVLVAGHEDTEALGVFTFQATTPDYFATMRTRILRGRGFTGADGDGAPEVAVISVSMARVLWPGQDALGKCFRMRAETEPCRQVVGIAEDMAQRELTGDRYHYYIPIDQYPRSWGIGLIVRLRVDSAAAVESTRRALQAIVPGASYVNVLPLANVVEAAQRPWRFGATIFTVFGVLALVVAAVGLHGIVAHSVAQRRRELSVRVALGARQIDIVGLVVGGSGWLAAVGSALGMAVAAVASRWIQPLLFQQSAIDIRVYLAVCLAMLLVAVLASAAPAWTAMHTDPGEALRADA